MKSQTPVVRTFTVLILGMAVAASGSGARAQQVDREDSKRQRLIEGCPESEFWFDARCRDRRYFQTLLPEGQDLIAVSGVKTRRVGQPSPLLVVAHSGPGTIIEYLVLDAKPRTPRRGQAGQGLEAEATRIAGADRTSRLKPSAEALLSASSVTHSFQTIERTLSGFTIVRQAIGETGTNLVGNPYVMREVLVVTEPGRLALYRLRITETLPASRFRLVTCESVFSAPPGTSPGCTEAVAIASTGQPQTSAGCQLFDYAAEFSAWGVGWACTGKAFEAAAHTTHKLSAVAMSDGPLPFGDIAAIGAGLAVMGVGWQVCDVVQALWSDAADVAADLAGCATAPFGSHTAAEVHDLLSDLYGAAELLVNFSSGLGEGECPAFRRVTETRTYASSDCGGNDKVCVRQGNQNCFLDINGGCDCGPVDWDNDGDFVCNCE